jgi:hypothetical protein
MLPEVVVGVEPLVRLVLNARTSTWYTAYVTPTVCWSFERLKRRKWPNQSAFDLTRNSWHAWREQVSPNSSAAVSLMTSASHYSKTNAATTWPAPSGS